MNRLWQAGAAGPVEDEDFFEEVDPHPDTPDDYDDDAVADRQSIEAVIEL